MKIINLVLCILIVLTKYNSLYGNDKLIINSPDTKISVTVNLTDSGSPYYTVRYQDSVVLKKSELGLEMNDNNFSTHLKMENIGKTEQLSDSYKLICDKKSNCNYKANKNFIQFKNSNGALIKIVFQVSDDGLAFRYEFGGTSSDIRKIVDERTSFHFPVNARAWLHPHADAHTGWNFTQPSYEENYWQDIKTGTDAPYKAGWSFPALFKSAGHWVLITESNVERNFCGSRLSAKSPDGEYKITYPQLPERTDSTAPVYPESKLPWNSPWRVIIIGETLAPIIESTLVTDVSEPCRIKDTSFVKPGKASWTWVLYKDDSTIYSTQKRFIDYASKMNWRYCLIDAFWDKNIGYEKIKELVDYGKKKNVGIILWYNSAGSWNTAPLTPRNLMYDPVIRKKEFERIHNMGVAGVKIDFFGGDGQSMMAYYHDLFEDAATYKLLINCHGATIPRGWTRTYPNLVSMEAVKGFEYLTFWQGNTDQEAVHCSILPFTRNAIGPMDFTPVCFSEIPNIKRISSNGFELATSILFQSGIQHYAEVPEGMFRQPDYIINFMKSVPERWEDIKFIDGYPGQFVVLARKGNGKWFIAGINALEVDKEINLDFSLFGKFTKKTLIADGDDNRSFSKKEIPENKLRLQIKPKGGFVIILE